MGTKHVIGAASAAAGLGVLLTLFTYVYRPWHMCWGAADEEVGATMPGDELVPEAHFSATRGISIRAQPEEIWPWLVQVGYGRAGFYAYDLVDLVLPCLLSPSIGQARRECLGKRSAEVILDDLQDVQAGTWIPMAPGQPSRETAFQVRAFERNRWMVWEKEASTWCWVLRPTDEGRTRLVSRIRCHYRWNRPTIVSDLFLMELGIS